MLALEQGALSGPAQIRAEQNARPAKFTAQDEGVVVGFGETVVCLRMQHGPVAETVVPVDLLPASG